MQLQQADISSFYVASQAMKELCQPLFEHTPIRYFDYQHYYRNGRYLSMSTHPEYTIRYINRELYPNLSDLDTQSKLNTQNRVGENLQYVFMSEVMALPQGAAKNNPRKYINNILMSKEFDIHHRIYFIKPENDYFKLCGFGIPIDSTSIFEGYLNLLDFFERFITYFEFQGYHLIEQAKKTILQLDNFVIPTKLSTIQNESVRIPPLDLFPDFYHVPVNANEVVKLSHREMECLILKMNGDSAKEIGKFLGISNRTVEKTLLNIKEKTRLLSKYELNHLLNEQGVFRLFSGYKNIKNSK